MLRDSDQNDFLILQRNVLIREELIVVYLRSNLLAELRWHDFSNYESRANIG